MINLGTHPGRNCPNIRLTPRPVDRILEALALLVQLALWGCIYWITTHSESTFDSGIWMLGGVATFTSILLGACAYGSVKFYNFPVAVDERNIAVQYLLAVRLVRVLNVLLGLFFVAIIFKECTAYGALYFFVMVALQALAILVYFVLAYKYK